MALVVQDATGFDIGGIELVELNAQAVDTNGSYPQIQASGGRRNGKCIRIDAFSGLSYNFDSDQEFTWAGAIRINANATSRTALTVYKTGTILVHFGISVDGRMTAYRGSGSSNVLAVSSQAFLVDKWKQLQVYVKIDDSAGEVQVYFDGSPTADLDFSGDTAPASQTSCDSFKIGGAGAGGETYDFDDMVWATGGTDLIGDVAVVGELPQSDGDEEDLNLSSGTDSTALIDEDPPPADDVDYLHGTTEASTFNYTDLPYTPGSILAVVQKVTCRKDDGTARTISDRITDTITPETGSQAKAMITDYVCVPLVRQLIAAGALTKSNVDTFEWGVKVAE